MLNEVKGNMYDWVTHTWNPIKGECPHNCSYCYMKKWGVKMKPARLVVSELKTDLGQGNTIFVGSSCDMWASGISGEWIDRVLFHCMEYDKNKYVFQSKNPIRFISKFSLGSFDKLFGTTIESDQWHSEMHNSPEPIARVDGMLRLKDLGYKMFVTIEPIMNFHLPGLVEMIKAISPVFVNIGANTNTKVQLEEPSPIKLQALIEELSEFTEVRKKLNLKRLFQAAGEDS